MQDRRASTLHHAWAGEGVESLPSVLLAASRLGSQIWPGFPREQPMSTKTTCTRDQNI